MLQHIDYRIKDLDSKTPDFEVILCHVILSFCFMEFNLLAHCVEMFPDKAVSKQKEQE